jgi:transcriptional regulator with PAS, ATPase and Fis domain
VLVIPQETKPVKIVDDKPSVPASSLRERVRLAARQVERGIIKDALEQHRWNRRRTAEALKISYRSLMQKMKACNLRDDTPEQPNI